MKRDLEIAREIQQWLVPSEPPHIPGMDIAFATRPQNTVAGDYYDAFFRAPASGGRAAQALLVVVADVAGKSVPAALLMATFQAGLRALSATPATLEEIIIGMERYTRAHSLEGRRFTTAFIAEITHKHARCATSMPGTTIRFSGAHPASVERLSKPADRHSACRFLRRTRSPTNWAVCSSSPAICSSFLPTESSRQSTRRGRSTGRRGCLAILAGPGAQAAADLKRVMSDVNSLLAPSGSMMTLPPCATNGANATPSCRSPSPRAGKNVKLPTQAFPA